MDVVHKVVHTMPKQSMTASWVQSVKVDEGREVFYDLKVTGLGLRVSFTGKKTWEVMYRVKGDKSKYRMDLGTYPALSLAEAREKATAIILEAARGLNPKKREQAEALARDKAPTFGELADRFLKEYASKKRSHHQMELAIKKDLLPAWSKVKAKDISRQDVRGVLQSVYDRGAPIQANRTLALVRSIFNWGIEQDLVESNPSLGIKPLSRENPRDRVLNDDEIRAAWAAFEEIGGLMGELLKLRLVTAQRGAEVKTMRWQDVDLVKGWWTIPKEVAKNGKSHRVPLSALALAILTELHKQTGEKDWVFPSRTKPGQPIKYVQKAAERVKDKSRVDFVLHDLRRTSATTISSITSRRDIVKRILNHSEGNDVTGIYDRYAYDNEKRLAMDAWCDRLVDILTK